jgi:hypothetical protein
MPFEILDQGYVTRREPSHPLPVAAGPRCVLTDRGELVCSYNAQSKLGVNDFVPGLARSGDLGKTWQDQGPVFPDLVNKQSMFLNISRSREGELFLFGSRCKIDRVGESFWSDATQGLKPNEMMWASSSDDGQTWSSPHVIGNLMPGAAEAPGPLTVTRDSTWVGPYSPYNTFDPNLKVDREQVVVLLSKDRGRTWSRRSMLRFEERNSGGAEAWCVELADGRLVGTAWHIDHTPAAPGTEKRSFANKYALSRDGGSTWSPTRSIGTMGNTTSLAPLPDGQLLYMYVKRKPANEVGLWLAIARPTDTDFGMEHHEMIWRASAGATQKGGSVEHDNWVEYNFGEPGMCLLPDGSLLVAFWYIEAEHSGVRYLKLRLPS